jgi:HK97 gp10 family phage protein
MAESYKIEGLDALKRNINELTADLKRKVVRAGLRDAAAPIARQARANAPVLKEDHPYRLPNTLKKSIITKASKEFNGKNGVIGVYISVKKRKGLGGKESAKNPFDPFYWRFMEFGFTAVGGKKITGGTNLRNKTRNERVRSGAAKWIPGKRFMGRAFDANSARAIDIFKARLKVRIDKANKKASK